MDWKELIDQSDPLESVIISAYVLISCFASVGNNTYIPNTDITC